MKNTATCRNSPKLKKWEKSSIINSQPSRVDTKSATFQQLKNINSKKPETKNLVSKSKNGKVGTLLLTNLSLKNSKLQGKHLICIETQL